MKNSAAPASRAKAARPEADTFLQRLGDRVRTTRNRRGMSRRALAKHARVSERYLAQLETGQGNCSIVLLRRIARAMGVPVAELVDDRPERPVETILLDQFLDRLSPQELREARELLLGRFGGALGDLRRNRIALIGLRGGGKSTLGRLLAEKLGAPFIELDREVERLNGTNLSEIFEMFGQETFHRMERLALEQVLQRFDRFVLATGGSIVTEPATFELLISSCLTIWVRADPDEHMQRVVAQGDLRPMAENSRAMDDLVSILKSREPLYARADVTLQTAHKAPEQSLEELLALLGPEPRQAAPKRA
jgi:XRE family aerobic/anaerobic benzoate catabolism transcriptional regulator